MTRINVEIEKKLHHKAKVKAALENKTFVELIPELLEKYVGGKNG